MDLVIGGSGFIGSHLVDALVRRGRRVRVYDRAPFPADGGLRRPTEYVQGDILDPSALGPALEGCPTVFHLAANAQFWDPDPGAFVRVNVGGTLAVLEAARQRGVRRLVYTSSALVLSPRARGGAIREGTRTTLGDMIGPYSRSKFRAERAVLLAASRGLPALAVYPTMPIGPGDRNLTPPGRMILDFLQGRIRGYVDCVLNCVDVRDVALGHALAAERGRTGRRYLLAGHDTTLAALFQRLGSISGVRPPRLRLPYALALAASYVEEWLGRLTGRRPQSSVTGVRLCRRRLAYDAGRTWRELGHAPRPLEESLRDAVAFFRAWEKAA